MVNKTKTLLSEFLAACSAMDAARARLDENKALFSEADYEGQIARMNAIKTQITAVQNMSASLSSVMTSALPPSHATVVRAQSAMTSAASFAMQGATALMSAMAWKINRDIDQIANPTETSVLGQFIGGAHFAALGAGLSFLSRMKH